MEKTIPSSLIGYNKQTVNEIIKQKDTVLHTQQEDINYLRKENLKLKTQLKKQDNQQNK